MVIFKGELLMLATLRRIKTQPGPAAEVARLIEAEYLPQIEGVDGFISYTLIDLGNDEISSLGIFTSEARAQQANAAAHTWTSEPWHHSWRLRGTRARGRC
jgi:hypothetical protein